MKRLHIELVLALQFDEPHRRPRRRFRDPLGVAIVVLLRLDIGPHIFGRHQPHVVVVSGKHAAGLCQSNGRSSAYGVARPDLKRHSSREGAPLGQCGRASLLVNLAGDEMALLIEMVVDLGVN